ncbi:OLC1v1019551C1 [Oldenlandia corymbosa var. corymbosa]|uniref:OLC1v1019551C1 n=1 Tax=Oldenlandia corymbosa var. corymbosa TaxID=529605 RepID=A0AAV1EEF1_OLDCO|nr:OLC1v1019551C1 [Oldenlandia corymbosa var. corymbosa]
MHALKDTISDKLSQLFSDSPSQNSDQQLQVRPSMKERKSWSSLLPFGLPSVSFEWFKSSNHQNDAKLQQSDSFSWRSKSFSLKDIPLDRHIESSNGHESHGGYSVHHNNECGGSISRVVCQKKELINADADNGDPGSARRTGDGSDIFEDARDANGSGRLLPNLTDDSLFVSPDLYEFFESSLPNIVKGCQWVLLYSTARHGISLRTLIRKSSDLSGPCLLITGDKQGAIFGGLLECPLKPTAKRKYQGTNQSFVFTTLYGEPRLFRPTGVNRYFYLCLNDLLALGGGGNFALCLDGELLSGSSGPCETYGNLGLAHDPEFDLKHVELSTAAIEAMGFYARISVSLVQDVNFTSRLVAMEILYSLMRKAPLFGSGSSIMYR